MLQDDWKSRIEKAALDVVWSHWIRLGANAQGKECQASVDPEALLILTAIIAKKDLRLMEVMGQWLASYEGIVNVERLKTALKWVSEDGRARGFYEALGKVLQENVPEQSLKRWSKILSILNCQKSLSAKKTNASRKKLQSHECILERNALIGFRYVLGVTAKADILYLLRVYPSQPNVMSVRPVTGAHIARMLHYDPATVLRALEELKEARLILCDEASAEKIYSINHESPHFSWPPKSDRFFVDWFALFRVFLDVSSFEDLSPNLHDSILLERLNARLEALDDVLKMVPRSHAGIYAKKSFAGVNQTEMRNSCEQAFYEIAEAMQSPSWLAWGSDGLTKFLDTAQRNLWASYARLQEFRRLVRFDALFEEMGPYLGTDDTLLESIFATRCHSAYRGAVRLAASGELPESFALMRSALESALYAFHVHRNPEKAKIWMERGDGEKKNRECRDAFKMGPILKEYEKCDAYNGEPTKKLYTTYIEYGAHPNAESVYSNIVPEDDAKGKRVVSLQLNTNELPLKHALVNAARTGACCLLILENIYKKRFQSSGLSDRLRGSLQGL